MSQVQTHALTDTFVATHALKRSIEYGIQHTPQARQIKMAYVPHIYQFIPNQA